MPDESICKRPAVAMIYAPNRTMLVCSFHRDIMGRGMASIGMYLKSEPTTEGLCDFIISGTENSERKMKMVENLKFTVTLIMSVEKEEIEDLIEDWGSPEEFEEDKLTDPEGAPDVHIGDALESMFQDYVPDCCSLVKVVSVTRVTD